MWDYSPGRCPTSPLSAPYRPGGTAHSDILGQRGVGVSVGSLAHGADRSRFDFEVRIEWRRHSQIQVARGTLDDERSISTRMYAPGEIIRLGFKSPTGSKPSEGIWTSPATEGVVAAFLGQSSSLVDAPIDRSSNTLPRCRLRSIPLMIHALGMFRPTQRLQRLTTMA